jgi:energy-coupling factor transporter ATP-binding protein EcfA2
MLPQMQPMSITITPAGGQNYKSISHLSWNNVPGFAILTGRNGSGKTQLLELLAYHLSGARPQGIPFTNPLPVTVSIAGVAYAADQVGFVPSTGQFSGGTPSSLATMAQVKNEFLQLAQNIHGYGSDISSAVRARKMASLLQGRSANAVLPDQMSEILGDNFEFAIADVDATRGISHVFMAHRFKTLEALERGTPGLDRKGNDLGPAPWTVVNASLQSAGFPYEVISPIHTSLVDGYLLRLKDKISGVEIAAVDLSSGEKVLLQLVLWLFTASKDGVFPKLLLLDEPDAHLHPSMTVQFLTVISEILVGRYGVRVIITSHSPSTVALAPEGSIFEIDRGAALVKSVTNVVDIISVLTAGLVTVTKSTRFCFVEDDDDVKFYAALNEILTDFGPARDPMSLNASPTVTFIAASIGAGASRVSGGSSVVRKWVGKLDAPPLDRTFLGIIDRDISNLATGRVRVLGRYSFENYLLDPINLYATLIDNGNAPVITNVSNTTGSEHLLKTVANAELQAIVDTVTRALAAASGTLVNAGDVNVTYTNGRTVSVPSWVIDHRGHDLLPIAQVAFGGTRAITPPGLIKALKRARMVPKELAELLSAVQAS